MVTHLDACEIENRAMAAKHFGDREVAVSETGVVVAGRELRRVGACPVVPVDSGDFDRDLDT